MLAATGPGRKKGGIAGGKRVVTGHCSNEQVHEGLNRPSEGIVETTELATVIVREPGVLDDTELDQLADVLIGVVAQGASVGFLPPLTRADAMNYWRGAMKPGVILIVAQSGGRIVGTAQLELAMRANGRHRAEVNKVLVHPEWQRKGIGRQIMTEIEAIARREGRTLLHLDTRDGDSSNFAYRALGWTEAGRIPKWARSASGTLDATVFYFKELG
jgi:GNAT superfamily N-acetyltransferase